MQFTPLIAAPTDISAREEWRKELAVFRKESAAQLRYDGSLYERAEFAWVQSSFACCMAMLFDTQLYDADRACWNLEAFLADGDNRLGGYDSVVFWHAYPRIGFDHRNQFDFYRDMPGGLQGLAALAQSLHSRGIRVFVDYNPWDTSTRREQSSDEAAMAEIVRAIDADGVFLDTLAAGRQGWRSELDRVRTGVALESEHALPLEGIATHHFSWAQGFVDSHAPGVLRNKWFERRHMMHVVNRWRTDHHHDIQMAWMNGTGLMIWENVFGTQVPTSAADAKQIRLMLANQRRFAHVFTSEMWTPLVETNDREIYASLWQHGPTRLWTLCNRSASAKQGGWLEVDHQGDRVFDLVNGDELSFSGGGSHRRINLPIDGHGIGAVLAVPPALVTDDLIAFLQSQKNRGDYFHTLSHTPDLRINASPVVVSTTHEMASIPAREWLMTVAYRERECGFYRSEGVQKLTPAVLDQLEEGFRKKLPEFGSVSGGALHQAVVLTRPARVASFAIDLTPVTNAQYREFLIATQYAPRNPENFLKHWRHGAPPAGFDDHPVVYVDHEDARAYARWVGKRLPTEDEWQLAAQGTDQRLYPWGNDWLADHCNATGPTTTPVRAFPRGRSPYGCYDMIGNTWEWTARVHHDGRTRFCILKGGSFYSTGGSDWYADGGPRYCNFASKFVLLWPGLDRCATIGFRCAADMAT